MLLFLGNVLFVKAQTPNEVTESIAAIVTLDSFVVTAQRQGFSVEDFIDMVIADESYYQAFKNLRSLPHHAQNEITFFDKKHRKKAHYNAGSTQFHEDNCSWIEIQEEQLEGNLRKKNNSSRYYTEKLYRRVFLPLNKRCNTLSNTTNKTVPSSRIEKHIGELKTLIFNPGKRVDVPFIGKKTAIFEPQMQPYYNYDISSKKIGEKDCYVFRIAAKPDMHSHNNNATVIKYLETFFDKENFQIVGRNYHLKYAGAAFDFDIKMKVKIRANETTYFPYKVYYNGEWDIPFQKPEICEFIFRIE